jgi:RimJ/RimL family protein N-acetyltransferase
MKDELIQIRHARLEEKQMVYRWLCCSETTSLHSGPPNYLQSPVPSWEEFRKDFEDYYFISEGRSAGSVMIIEKGKEEIGCICYTAFHLFPKKAELDIWFNQLKHCGKGYGVKALNLLCSYLKEQFNISMFIIRPAVKNINAIKAYKKVGFEEICNEIKVTTIQDWVRPEYFEKYGCGDYGVSETAILIKSFESKKDTNDKIKW